mgnify:FL=1
MQVMEGIEKDEKEKEPKKADSDAGKEKERGAEGGTPMVELPTVVATAIDLSIIVVPPHLDFRLPLLPVIQLLEYPTFANLQSLILEGHYFYSTSIPPEIGNDYLITLS